ncbi:hypothetical protein DV515_00014544 [Chloebia gouldiae]|uniref:Uncharacterized protein n=1 Tax=Chloebia gouldiae TaxID=44316 RepID=A0A3L8RXN3_CHLGU|nr:hypothetical protein DV515_00014544 [Chloebia gouldiae]
MHICRSLSFPLQGKVHFPEAQFRHSSGCRRTSRRTETRRLLFQHGLNKPKLIVRQCTFALGLARVLGLPCFESRLALRRENQELQELEVTRWSSWFEKVKNVGNKIPSAFLPVNQQKGGRGRRAGCEQSFLLWLAALDGASPR